jgi:hypothetical protein
LAETERRGVRRENPRHEYLYWLPGVDTEYGYMPGNYEIAFSEAQRRGLEKFGGVDVSDDPKAWQEYDRLIQEAYNERL